MAGDTQLVTLAIDNGIDRNITTYQGNGKWVDADKIRFKSGNVEKLGGWSKLSDGGKPFRGVAREAMTWAALNSDKFYGLGTNLGLFIYSGGNWYDVTPIRFSHAETSAFGSFIGTSTVKVSVAGHGALIGDYAEFIGGVSLAGLTLEQASGVYAVTSVNANNFTIETSAAANATRTKDGGTGAKTINLLLNSGKADNQPTTGYGSGPYGSGVYGTGTAGSLVANMQLWSLDAWGEDLMALPRGGQVYRWDKSDGLAARASIASSAIPTRSNFLLITEETRCMMLFGTSTDGGDFDPLWFRWSQQEDYTIWSAAVTNAAGGLRLNSGSYIVGAVKSKGDILAFTDEGAHTITYEGAPFFFGQQRVGTGCGLIGPNAAVDVNGVVYWMGYNSFFTYTGVVQKLPSSLDKAVFEADSSYSLNYSQKEKVYAGHNTEFSEVWWLYPTVSSMENNRYVVYNYLDGFWYDGNLDRTTWVDSGLFPNPLSTSTSTVSYNHEVFPHDADGNNLGSFIESGYMDISHYVAEIGGRSTGQEMVFSDKIIPDVKNLTGDYMKVYVKYKKHPLETEKIKGPYKVGPNTKKIPLRLRGRQIAFRVEVSGVGSDFQLGNWRGSMMQDGER